MLYRINTEDLNRGTIESIVSAKFQGFSVLDQVGFWQGARESSLAIEIETEETRQDDVLTIAAQIKAANNQQAVLVQRINTNSYLV